MMTMAAILLFVVSLITGAWSSNLQKGHAREKLVNFVFAAVSVVLGLLFSVFLLLILSGGKAFALNSGMMLICLFVGAFIPGAFGIALAHLVKLKTPELDTTPTAAK